MIIAEKKIPREKVMFCKQLYAKMGTLRSVLLIMKENKKIVQELGMSEKDFNEAKATYQEATQAFEKWWDDIYKEYNLPARDDERYQSSLDFISCNLLVLEK